MHINVVSVSGTKINLNCRSIEHVFNKKKKIFLSNCWIKKIFCLLVLDLKKDIKIIFDYGRMYRKKMRCKELYEDK